MTLVVSPHFHEKVPKKLHDNLRYRKKLIKVCRRDTRLREAVREMCKRDIIYWINAFIWTHDPRLKLKTIPFVTWEWQDEAIHRIGAAIDGSSVSRQDLVIEKSRDMGATWMCLLQFLHRWWFFPDNSFLILSHKEALVEKPGDMDALFSKLDFVLARVPRWLRPNEGRTEKEWRRKAHLENCDNGSIIDGDSTTGKAGVGGRRTAILVDEFSRMAEGQLIFEGTADTTRCRIFNFTPFGSGNASHSLATKPGVNKLVLHWSKDPRKNRGMYQWDLKKNKCTYHDPTYHYPRPAQEPGHVSVGPEEEQVYIP